MLEKLEKFDRVQLSLMKEVRPIAIARFLLYQSKLLGMEIENQKNLPEPNQNEIY